MYFSLLTRIKNGQMAQKETVRMPFAKVDFAVAEVLAKKHFVAAVSKKGKGVKRIIEIQLKYQDGVGAIRGAKFLSKPSRRLYVGYKDIRPVKQGFGVLVLSTPKGIMAGSQARREKVGGEALFEVW
jgi:small subunit ribosomal protein S8